MVELHRLRSFAAVVEAGSFTGAARRIGLTKAMVSMHVKQLEEDLGVSLLQRTTRKVSTTEVGARFFADSTRLLALADEAVDDARAGQSSLHGTLRVSSTPEYGVHCVVPALAAFRKRHPALRIQFFGSAKLDDLVAQRLDVAIRMGQLRDSSHKAAQLGRFRCLVVATPEYLAGRKVPKAPAELAQLDWVSHSNFSVPRTFTGPDGVERTISIAPQVTADTVTAVLGFTLADCGISIMPDWMVEGHLADGRLVELVPEHHLLDAIVFAIYPSTARVPAKVRRFVDFMRTFVAGRG